MLPDVGPTYLDLLLHGVRVMAMCSCATPPCRCRPPPSSRATSTSGFSSSVPRSRLAGACTPAHPPPNWAWEGAEGDDDVPDELYLFHETICASIRVIDQSFGVDHINDLWPAEDEKWDEERLWGRPEDDSKTNTDSEAEDALEFMLAFA